tara:strand:+ start:359 stop:652 length:294 start_codon:yes stop_codon:yes gene_type:complete
MVAVLGLKLALETYREAERFHPLYLETGEPIMLQDNNQIYLVVSAIIFGLVASIHLVRALNNWAFIVGPMTIPIPASWVGFIITLCLCLWAVRLIVS